jgi:hypothetical protein
MYHSGTTLRGWPLTAAGMDRQGGKTEGPTTASEDRLDPSWSTPSSRTPLRRGSASSREDSRSTLSLCPSDNNLSRRIVPLAKHKASRCSLSSTEMSINVTSSSSMRLNCFCRDCEIPKTSSWAPGGIHATRVGSSFIENQLWSRCPHRSALELVCNQLLSFYGEPAANHPQRAIAHRTSSFNQFPAIRLPARRSTFPTNSLLRLGSSNGIRLEVFCVWKCRRHRPPPLTKS